MNNQQPTLLGKVLLPGKRGCSSRSKSAFERGGIGPKADFLTLLQDIREDDPIKLGIFPSFH